ncbi:putative 3-hydroxyphenylpropionic transporter MhpT [Serratia fonticola]|uniref:Putative 3-hydroxyphenylpropionic transporter MhpT n=1 Tax=Serratia fonticola TaxID=47917 RepID=A0A4U9ULG1_SERFO|nr:putative 3-hydroxyphenylpropionic transporter MhpT [Serratia fonticola]
MGMTRSYHTMMTLRILLGIAEGPLLPMAYAIVRQAFPQRLQARATMLWLLGTPIGAALGFPVTLFILSRFNWETTFFFYGVSDRAGDVVGAVWHASPERGAPGCQHHQ